MPSLQFRKMRFYGHIGKSPKPDRGGASDGRLVLDSTRAEHPAANCHAGVRLKGVLGYREAARCEFPRSVASSTQVSSICVRRGRLGTGICLMSDKPATAAEESLATSPRSEKAAIRVFKSACRKAKVLATKLVDPSRHFSKGGDFEKGYLLGLLPICIRCSRCWSHLSATVGRTVRKCCKAAL
jgi:hypothetical protein